MLSHKYVSSLSLIAQLIKNLPTMQMWETQV